jgi:hypothetical protein
VQADEFLNRSTLWVETFSDHRATEISICDYHDELTRLLIFDNRNRTNVMATQDSSNRSTGILLAFEFSTTDGLETTCKEMEASAESLRSKPPRACSNCERLSNGHMPYETSLHASEPIVTNCKQTTDG